MKIREKKQNANILSTNYKPFESHCKQNQMEEKTLSKNGSIYYENQSKKHNANMPKTAGAYRKQ